MAETIGEILAKYDDPAEAWRSKAIRKELQSEYFHWLAEVRKWSTFGTLTVDPKYGARPPDVCKNYFRKMLQLINTQVFGKHYTQKVHHSYFNYVLAVEMQKREVCHLHFLADRPLPYQFIHNWWHMTNGHAWLMPIYDAVGAMDYVTKYVIKGGVDNLDIFLRAPLEKMPKQLPSWWVC